MSSPIHGRSREIKPEIPLGTDPVKLREIKAKAETVSQNIRGDEATLFCRRVAPRSTYKRQETLESLATLDKSLPPNSKNWLKSRIKKDPVLFETLAISIMLKTHNNKSLSSEKILDQIIESPKIQEAAMDYITDQFKQKNYVEAKGEKPQNSYKMTPTVFLNPALFEQKKIPLKQAGKDAEIILRKNQIKECKELLKELRSMNPAYAKSIIKDFEQFIEFTETRIQNINLVTEIQDLEAILNQGALNPEEIVKVKAMISTKQEIIEAMTSGFYNTKEISGKGVPGMRQNFVNVTHGSLLEKKDEINKLNFELLQANKELSNGQDRSKMEIVRLENKCLKLEVSILKNESQLGKIEEAIADGTYNQLFESTRIKKQLDRESEHIRVLDGIVQIQLTKSLNQSAKKINQMEPGKKNRLDKTKKFFS